MTNPPPAFTPGTADALRLQLARIAETPTPGPFWTRRDTLQFRREAAVSIEKSNYLGEYLVYLVGRVAALEAEVAALKK